MEFDDNSAKCDQNSNPEDTSNLSLSDNSSLNGSFQKRTPRVQKHIKVKELNKHTVELSLQELGKRIMEYNRIGKKLISEEDELEEQDIWGEILPGMVNSDGAAFGGTGAKEGPGCVVDNEVPRYVRASPRADLCAYTSDGRSYTTGAPSSMSGSSLIF